MLPRDERHVQKYPPFGEMHTGLQATSNSQIARYLLVINEQAAHGINRVCRCQFANLFFGAGAVQTSETQLLASSSPLCAMSLHAVIYISDVKLLIS